MTRRVPYVPTTLTIDSYDTRALGFIVEAWPNARDVVTQDVPAVAAAGIDGLTATDLRARAGERRFTTRGTLMASSLATLQANYRALQFKAFGGPRVLTLVDDTTKRITAWGAGLTFEYLGPDAGTEVASVELQWRALDPWWESTSTTTVALTNVAAACALGTTEAWPVITFDQNATLTYKNAGGSTLYTLQITGISGGQTVTVDMRTRTVTHSSSGVTPSLRAGGRFFPLSPYDGDYPTASWPTLQLSTGTGTAVYRKRWLA